MYHMTYFIFFITTDMSTDLRKTFFLVSTAAINLDNDSPSPFFLCVQTKRVNVHAKQQVCIIPIHKPFADCTGSR